MIPKLQTSATEGPVGKSTQRLRWFVNAFEAQVEQTATDTGNEYQIDYDKLPAIFVSWLSAFNAQKPAETEDRPAYVSFAAGLMLKELVDKNPLKLVSMPEDADADKPAYFWPEGFTYLAFCLNVRGLVLEKDYQATQELSKDFEDTRTWWSFRENVEANPALAIAFLDFFANGKAQWSVPGLFQRKGVGEIPPIFLDRTEGSEQGA